MVLQPIQSYTFNKLIQGDLIDYSHKPDSDWRWVLHLRCHYSTFTALYPLKTKEAGEIANYVRQWCMHWGPFPIWHSDNGAEFKGLLETLLINWGIKIRHGRPRQPQTQGGVERANGIAKAKINTLMYASGNPHWSQHLTAAADQINRAVSQTTGYSPYMIAMGGRQPPPFMAPLSADAAATAVIEEVEIELDGKELEELNELPEIPQVVRAGQLNTVCVHLNYHPMQAYPLSIHYLHLHQNQDAWHAQDGFQLRGLPISSLRRVFCLRRTSATSLPNISTTTYAFLFIFALFDSPRSQLFNAAAPTSFALLGVEILAFNFTAHDSAICLGRRFETFKCVPWESLMLMEMRSFLGGLASPSDCRISQHHHTK